MLKYTKEQLQHAVSTSYSIAQVLEKFSIVPAGGNYSTVKKYLKIWSIDNSHFTGQIWRQGKVLGPKRPLSAYLSNNFSISSHRLRLRLLKDKVFEHICNKCKTTTWLNSPVPLELHHKDGNHDNNSLENLELICPNCHAFTTNYRGLNKS